MPVPVHVPVIQKVIQKEPIMIKEIQTAPIEYTAPAPEPTHLTHASPIEYADERPLYTDVGVYNDELPIEEKLSLTQLQAGYPTDAASYALPQTGYSMDYEVAASQKSSKVSTNTNYKTGQYSAPSTSQYRITTTMTLLPTTRLRHNTVRAVKAIQTVNQLINRLAAATGTSKNHRTRTATTTTTVRRATSSNRKVSRAPAVTLRTIRVATRGNSSTNSNSTARPK